MVVFMADTRNKIIREIAGNLDCGCDCYYNLKSDEIVAIPNFDNFPGEDEFREMFKEDIKRVEVEKADFIKFEVLSSFDSFRIRERFTAQLPDNRFKMELEVRLRGKKPFQNFKHFVEGSAYRQEWFDFKQNEMERIVEIQLDLKKPALNNGSE